MLGVCAYDIICLVYILYDIFTDSGFFKCCHGPHSRAASGSNAAPGLFKCKTLPVQMQDLLVHYVCLSVLAPKSGCRGLLLHIRHLTECTRILPPSPSCSLTSLPCSSWPEACLPDFGASLYQYFKERTTLTKSWFQLSIYLTEVGRIIKFSLQ